ncbi:MAG TPA: hypothetical protein VML55_17925 [Planctomycetaceae bacterium]|nr:hypothetical protein [Planctomycetaceae bacterium]
MTESNAAHTSGTQGEVHQPHESGIAVAEVTGPLFNEQELAEFESDDRHAGRAIGKLLSGFFLYTVIVMTIVALWTLKSLSH